jgi:molybdenum cofactor cytidylyltransferase
MQEVLSHDVDRVLIVLGDMPFVTPLSLQRLLEAYSAGHGCGSISGVQRCPPACFPRGSFHELMAQSGDQGARALLHELPSEALVTLSDREALDIDTQDQIGLYADIAQTDLGRVGTDAQFIKSLRHKI